MLHGLLACLCAAPLSAAAAIVDIRWSDGGAFEHRFEVAPGRFAEACGAIPSGTVVRWVFEASAATDFNIHWHEGRKVVMPEKRQGVAQGDGSLTVATPHEVCWMWTAPAAARAPVTLTLRLQR